jgi:NAD(P)-dependent dehydrogenase (short-subunit alcohol dehydrogenase family)
MTNLPKQSPIGPPIALVTGAGSGIGRASALAFNEAGFSVVLAGRRKDALEETRGMAKAGCPPMVAMPADISLPEDVDRLFEFVEREFGRLDLLFNNAGVGAFSLPIDELPREQWLNVVNVNLNGAFFCAQAAVTLMKRQKPQGGRIINNGSVSAHVPRPNSAPYTATKHAITGLTKCISLDGRAFRIACGQIDVGNAASALTEKMAEGILQSNGQIVAEPRMDLEHVAKAVVYMATLPLEANVQFMTVMATTMPFIGRG